MSEGSGATSKPYVVDVSVLVAVARADVGVTRLLMNLDSRGQTLVIPILAMVAASLDVRTNDADITLRGLERLDNVFVAPLRDAEQAAGLATVAALTSLELPDAHVAAVADTSACPILTLEAGRWRQHASDLDKPLDIIEIADPDEG